MWHQQHDHCNEETLDDMKSRIGNRTSQTITSDGALTTALMTTTTTTLQFDSNLYVRYAHHGHEPLYLLSTNNMLFIWWCFFSFQCCCSLHQKVSHSGSDSDSNCWNDSERKKCGKLTSFNGTLGIGKNERVLNTLISIGGCAVHIRM